jgi:type IV pilus assembly protein PilC
MSMFEYEAKTMQGTPIKGKMDAVSEEAVISALRSKGYFPTSIRQNNSILSMDIGMLKKVKIKDIAIFCRQFAVIITAGIPVLRGLEIVKAQTENKKLKKILTEVFDDVQKGRTLSDAMKKHKDFPDMLCNMITVGEASGTLDMILERMALFYEKENKLNQKVKGAMTYPIAVSIFALGVVVLLITKVLPTFTGMLTSSGGELPVPTKILMGISDFINTKWYLLVAGIIVIIVLIRTYLSTENGRYSFDNMKLKLPVFGKLYKKVATARFARTFGTLMGSGIPIMNSIEICSNVIGNAVLQKLLESTQEDIKKGLGMGETLETRNIFPPMLTQMIKIGEEAGTLDEVLESTASFYDEEVDTATNQMTNLIQPVIIVILAVVVGFIIISILLPMFNMYDAVGQG